MCEVYSFEQHCAAFPELAVETRQALGVEGGARMRPLDADGIVGPLTRGGMFIDPTSGHKLIEAALWAVREGAREIGGNNSGVWVEGFMRVLKMRGKPQWRKGLAGGKQGMWCAGFASWAVMEAYGSHAPRSWSARRITQLWEQNGQEIALKDTRPGDMICWQRYDAENPVAGHVGIVAAVEGDRVLVIEGNGTRRFGRVGVYAYSLKDNAVRGTSNPQQLHMIARRVAG